MDYRKYLVLFVDDNKSNRVVMQHTLGREFNLIIAESGTEALYYLATRSIAVLLTDHRMPGMTGVDLAEKTFNDYPEIVRIIITAYSDIEITVDAINRGRVDRFLKKPWTYEELLVVVRESIKSYHNTQMVKQMQERLLSVDRAASLGIMASGIAHDIRQPLSNLLPSIGIAKEHLQEALTLKPEGRLGELVRSINNEIDDVAHGAEMLKMFANSLVDQVSQKDIEKETIDLKDVIKNAVGLVRSKVVERARLELELPGAEIAMQACPSRLSQLIVNLLLNAAQAIEPGDPLDNSVVVKVHPDVDSVTIEVDDSGSGISKEHQDRIFDPGFSTKQGDGSGLGLAICKQCVDAHEGEIVVSSSSEEGTRFTIKLPRGTRSSAPLLPTS